GTARPGRNWIPVGAAVVAAVAFAPVRNRIQILVDKAFFRRGYDFRRGVHDFSAAAGKACGRGEILDLFENALAEMLPVEKVAGIVLEPGGGPPGIVLRRGLDDAAVSLLAGPPEPGTLGTNARPDVPGFEVTLPLPLGDGGLAGWVFVGPKKSGLEFTEEDRELLETLAAEAAAALRRIRLQEEVAYERASREKSEELGRLKTEFISSVSHELRTPMTSLQGISQLLQSGKVGDEARRERLLELMAGECGRLGRFLHNVLDFGRIEQDVKRYEFRETDLKPLVTEVAEIARSATAGDDLDLEVETPEGPVWVEADPDSVCQALLNLVDNAVKYSIGRKRVAVRLAEKDGRVEVSVSDRGIGIPAEDREKIFEAFFRSPAAVRHDPKGVGLGLKIVKHIMDAHGGTIDLRSDPGQGTTFTLKFPKRRKT
ncbi:MAG: HAMP domain-containing histidine kinase, partial [Candidatus Aminicenantes bacterium]